MSGKNRLVLFMNINWNLFHKVIKLFSQQLSRPLIF